VDKISIRQELLLHWEKKQKAPSEKGIAGGEVFGQEKRKG